MVAAEGRDLDAGSLAPSVKVSKVSGPELSLSVPSRPSKERQTSGSKISVLSAGGSPPPVRRGSKRGGTISGSTTKQEGSSAIMAYEKDEDKLDRVPMHLMDRVPLHLQLQQVIKKRRSGGLECVTETPQWDIVEYVENGVKYRSSSRRRTASRSTRTSKGGSKANRLSVSGADAGGALQAVEDQSRRSEDQVEFVSEKVESRKLMCLLGPCGVWSVLAMGFLLFHALHFLLHSREVLHTFHADGAIAGLDLNVTAVLSPALGAARAVLFGFRSGLLLDAAGPNLSRSMSAVLGPLMAEAPGIRIVQVAGFAGDEDLAFVVPGTLHDPTPAPPDRAVPTPVPVARLPDVLNLHTGSDCTPADPFGCMGLGLEGQSCGGVRAACWRGPAYVAIGDDAEEDWIWSHQLLAHSSPEPDSASGFLAISVAVDAGGLQSAVVAAAPDGGAAFICSEGGVIVAGHPGWRQPAAGEAYAESLPDLDSAWAGAPGLMDAVAADGRSELWFGEDLIIVQPLAASARGAGPFAGASPSLRVLVVAPRSYGVQERLDLLSRGALALAAAPFVLFFLILLALYVVFQVRCCAEFCRRQRDPDEEINDDIESDVSGDPSEPGSPSP